MGKDTLFPQEYLLLNIVATPMQFLSYWNAQQCYMVGSVKGWFNGTAIGAMLLLGGINKIEWAGWQCSPEHTGTWDASHPPHPLYVPTVAIQSYLYSQQQLD